MKRREWLFTHFAHIKKMCISKRERKMVLSVFVKYWFILLYHKCKVKYTEVRVVKVVLIRIIIGKNN